MTTRGRNRRIARASFSRVGGSLTIAASGRAEVLAQRDAEHLRGPHRLFGAHLGGSARAHLALREIEDADAMALPRGFGERATAGQLAVVAMRDDGEQVDVVHGAKYRLRHAAETEVPPRTGQTEPRPVRPAYSCRSAATGSSRAARTAGSMPNTHAGDRARGERGDDRRTAASTRESTATRCAR